ncbi:MAG: VanZ family protein [Myxococcales bacterium]|nr:MAG: VanZ family protein [Myxococcales bacterium]
MTIIFVVSSFEVEIPGIHHFPLRDKGIHLVEYAVLGWLCAAASRRTWPSVSAWRTVAFAVAVSALWGVSDEIHQVFVPGRYPEFGDAVADFCGSIVGASSQHFLSRRSVS